MTSISNQKNWFTAIRSMEKCFPSIWNWKKLFLTISSLTNTVATIWREKNVDPCYLETK